MKPRHELAHIIEQYGQNFVKKHPQPAHHLRTLKALQQCRTSALGGHVSACSSCGSVSIAYNSCRNRHCPKCQGTQRQKWLLLRAAELPADGCFHVVFTLPHQLNEWCMQHPAAVYNLLFAAAWQTIAALARNPEFLGADTGMVASLHTWGQQLSLHPHLHCIIPAGGVTMKGRWKKARAKGKYLFPKKAIQSIYRAKFMAAFTQWCKARELHLPQQLCKQLMEVPWMVHAEAPLRGSGQIIEYLARYTHKTAISNHRITEVDQGKVSFKYKDYRCGGRQKNMTLNAEEFLRRFCLHILPSGFRRIRHYGLLSNRNKSRILPWVKAKSRAIKLLDWKQICIQYLGFNPDQCPHCHKTTMVTILTLEPRRGPPADNHYQSLKPYALEF